MFSLYFYLLGYKISVVKFHDHVLLSVLFKDVSEVS